MSLHMDIFKTLAGQNIEKSPEEIAKSRLAKCDEPCPFRKWGVICEKCGCIISDKVKYIESTCPDGRWEQ